MRAGVGLADQHIGALDDFRHRLLVAVGAGGLELGVQPFFQRQIEEGVDDILIANLGDLGNALLFQLLVLRFDGVD